MATSGAERRPRRGPAPIASFDHDVSEESSPENKQAFRLPEIREDPVSSTSSVVASTSGGVDSLAPPEQRARSHSSPAVHTTTTVPTTSALQTPAAPRIDISRASSSSHQDSRDSSPELALFAGGGNGEDTRARLELGFREDGAADLRSSTEELAFLEGAPGGTDTRAQSAVPPSRRHSRKDSQSSEAALLAVSGRTSRLSSVGSQCSAHSALSGFSHASRISRLSVVSGTSRSPSPHKMLLETSFCGPKPIETDPEICTAAVEERLLEMAKLTDETVAAIPDIQSTPVQIASFPPVDARDRREVRTEVTVENARPASAPRLTSPNAPNSTPVPGPAPSTTSLDDEKRLKETRNRAKVEERRARSRDRREPAQPEVHRRGNRSKDIIRIKLKPDDEYEDDEDEESERTLISGEPARKPITLELNDRPARPKEPTSPQTTSRRQRDSRTPSPCGAPVSRKSSFCSLFKSRETIASPDSPSDALRRKKSLNEGRSRSKSRDRSTTPSSTGKIKGSVLSLFKTPRRSGTSPSPGSRDASPVVQQQRQFPQSNVEKQRGEKLKYYEDSKDGIIHIPLHTPPDEINSKDNTHETVSTREISRPASAPQQRAPLERNAVISSITPISLPKRTQRTVLPDGSIIIPLHSPTEKTISTELTANVESTSDIEQIARKPEIESTPDKSMNNISEQSSDAGCTETMVPEDIAAVANVTDRPRRKERIIFTTHVGSKEQVFSTQFSITKTPSITSEISESIPSFPENEEVQLNELTQPTSTLKNIEVEVNEVLPTSEEMIGEIGDEQTVREITTSPPPDTGRDSSESEASSEVATTHGGSEAERRGLVVQESFEELPYVPTTLPLERSLALPMIPVRDRSDIHVAGVQRPRATRSAGGALGALTPPSVPTPSSNVAELSGERLHIRLPRRARAASTASAAAPPPPPRNVRARSRSGGDATGMETRGKSDWIDFSEVPERRKQPKRIQTLPATARDSVVFSYVPPERCRCECHAHGHVPDAPPDDELPLLQDDSRHMTVSSSSLEFEEDGGHVQVNVHIAPFTADLDLQHNHADTTLPQ
ncbi:serine/arginine repetitive matrix protein 2 isoform X1 [Vanessa atalanta]|uniref:serine/arginine repetitive matrix protein 2 isoform X1 n=1 Tax=Vanessa atalanta TaxID=42275 RepID=UPI001FCDE8FD|nr:serine/arginine repetitive matrix protein 2 isoform X1 [Vanessa atalanta]XP_047533790.1 serine/arginine repetitive matrix protein 2 isoform X1 [Vanessa atalanta]